MVDLVMSRFADLSLNNTFRTHIFIAIKTITNGIKYIYLYRVTN